MPTYERCPKEVTALANDILCAYPEHKPLLDCKTKFDFVFASPDIDEKTGEALNDALKKHGRKALGIARKIPLKDRALGRGDVEIALDHPWWEDAPAKQKAALLDHELHHFEPKLTETGDYAFDDLGRPIIKLRKYDYEFGLFKIIAERHGVHSQECILAKRMMEESGQYFWPDLRQEVVA